MKEKKVRIFKRKKENRRKRPKTFERIIGELEKRDYLMKLSEESIYTASK